MATVMTVSLRRRPFPSFVSPLMNTAAPPQLMDAGPTPQGSWAWPSSLQIARRGRNTRIVKDSQSGQAVPSRAACLVLRSQTKYTQLVCVPIRDVARAGMHTPLVFVWNIWDRQHQIRQTRQQRALAEKQKADACVCQRRFVSFHECCHTLRHDATPINHDWPNFIHGSEALHLGAFPNASYGRSLSSLKGNYNYVQCAKHF